ncbi:hypothetical protein C0V72_03685 [Porphyrobacter sp. TH134]|uniref:DUF1801 domain-containing protein n=1 Tax=Porphyrobacter sp. TH134 TaxID=2067450 RepID=UPI000C79F248|nr:DUF1801 domain-containing protein [Porphyrobacter sp. TH134]PLK24854.1 hypothetical protein C0V72_03685 [Porphyrobacter sp. TH134]
MTTGSPEAFLAAIEPQARRDEAAVLDALFRRVTGETPKLWGAGIIGYGEYRTTYDSGRDVHWMRSGFSPKKAKHSLYLQAAYSDAAAAEAQARLLAQLGKHAMGKSCLYVNRLADIDLAVLEDIIAADWQAMLRLHPKD